MSNSTTLLDTITSTQANKEAVVNALFDAASPGMIWGRHASTSSNLTWGYYGGYYGGNAIANGTLTLTASTTNYVYADHFTGAVSVNTSGFPSGSIPLYSIVTGTSTVTSYTDFRAVQLQPQPYDLPMYFPSTYAASATIARIIFARTVQFAVNLPGSAASATNGSTGTAVLTLNKNGTAIGTLTFTSSTTGVISFTSAVTFNAGDIFTITAPSVADATFGGVSFTMVGTR